MKSNSGQAVNEAFWEVLDACCKQIEEKMGGKPIAEWRASDYNTLISQLGQRTKVYLSENTLKRIFGRLKTNNRYYPQQATRDALAQFLGYRDWQEFEVIYYIPKKTEPQPTEIQIVLPEKTDGLHPEPTVIKKSRQPFLYITLVLAAVLATLLTYILRKPTILPGDISLVCENPIGTVPHTAIFKLVPKKSITANEVFSIDFMDEAPITKISGNDQITQFFRNPGVVYARLLHDGKPIDTCTVLMETKGWVANSTNDTLKAFPVAGLKALSQNNIYVSPAQLDSAGLDLSKPFLVGFSNIHTSSISGDNFEFSCNLQSEESRPGIQCVENTVIILGDNGRHLVRVFRPNCAAFSEYEFSEEKAKGSAKYLGSIAYDFKDGGELKLRVEDKKVLLYLGGKKVFTTTYKLSIGKIMGIKVLFNGIGKVSAPRLSSLNGSKTF